jgi:hypothetical protein
MLLFRWKMRIDLWDKRARQIYRKINTLPTITHLLHLRLSMCILQNKGYLLPRLFAASYNMRHRIRGISFSILFPLGRIRVLKLMHVFLGVATKQIAQDMKISRRRVQQIWKSYAQGKQEPAIGENMGRPRKPFDEKEVQVVGEAYTLYRFGARMLEVAVRKVFKIRISHNRIHMYLKAAGLAHEDPQKKKRGKWVRYEWEHSLSAGHIDWHESGWSDLKVCAVIDGASRMILAGGEFKNVNTKNIKSVVDQLVERYWWLSPHARAYLGSQC